MSVVNVVLTTDGLFFTLGNIIPPLRENGFIVLCGIVFACAVLVLSVLEGDDAVVVGV